MDTTQANRRGLLRPSRRAILPLLVPGMLTRSLSAWGQAREPFRIGMLSDLSGIVADFSGLGTLTSMRMAVEDYGGQVLGRPIDLIFADHLNKPDIGIGIARKWYDEGVNAIFDVGLTGIAIGVQRLAREKNKVVVFISSSSSDLTGTYCGPNGVHWNHDSYSQSSGVIRQLMSDGRKDFYFMTVDYAYGANAEREAREIIEAAGGTVRGSTAHPFDATDYSSDLLKAQGSGAQVIALATNSSRVPTIMKQAEEFGIRKQQVVAPLSMPLFDVKAIGLDVGHGLLETTTYYWDQDDKTRAFAKRFFARFGKMPNMNHAAAYGAVMHYLKAVAISAGGAGDDTMKIMKATRVDDFMTAGGTIRADGQMMRDQHVLQVKSPAESTGEWDLYNVLASVPAERAYQKMDPAACRYVAG